MVPTFFYVFFVQESPPQPINLAPGNYYENNSGSLYLVTAFCRKTAKPKVMTISFGQDINALHFVSESGMERLSAAAPVPPGWHYRVDTDADGGCNFWSWPLS